MALHTAEISPIGNEHFLQTSAPSIPGRQNCIYGVLRGIRYTDMPFHPKVIMFPKAKNFYDEIKILKQTACRKRLHMHAGPD